MKIDILTLFPDMFAPLEHSIVGKAKDKGILEINYHNFRDNAEKARHVDDEPYGGGQGMLLRAQPIFDTFDKLNVTKPRVILLDPAGRTFNQAYAEELAQEEELVFICGHYEGYDERIKTLVTDEISLGDFVLTGGELAAMTIVDATVRLIPEVLGKKASHKDDSQMYSCRAIMLIFDVGVWSRACERLGSVDLISWKTMILQTKNVRF